MRNRYVVQYVIKWSGSWNVVDRTSSGGPVANHLNRADARADAKRRNDDAGPCTDCRGRGWLHMRSSDTGPLDHIERCDTCRCFTSDKAAAKQHAHDCACGRTARS
jgi:hypothetical protein